MIPEILAYLRNEPSDYAPTKLATIVHHWRDRLQTEDARAALVDELPLEASTATDAAVDAALTAWASTAESAWFAYAGVSGEVELAEAVQAALMGDTLRGWGGAHDALGACGLASVDAALGLAYSAARLAPYAETAGPPGPGGEPTTVREYKAYDATVAGLQASLRGVLVALCAGA